MRPLRDLTIYLRAIEESVATRAPRILAQTIAAELQDAGPNWTGTFMNSWRIVPGDQDVPATISRPAGAPYSPQLPQRQLVPPLPVGLRVKRVISGSLYTIGNAATHRLVAMDIVPGRLKPGGRGTAPQDWFATYVEGGRLNQTVRVTLDRELARAFNRR